MTNEALIMKDHNQMKASHLPFHIIRNIMLNLPLKSLLRFKLVSTQWLDEITNQDFARAQLLNHQKKVSSVIITTNHIMAYLRAKTFYVDNNALESRGGLWPFELRLPIDLSSMLISSLNICDGILCTTFNCFDSMLLWNPVTNWYKIVPLYRSEDIFYLGFGYNPSDNDYKLAIVVDLYIEIFSLKSCTWKRICSIPADDFYFASFYYTVHINGTFYWCQTHDFENGIYALSLDLIKEKFSKIPMPKPSAKIPSSVADLTRSVAGLTSYRDMLCMIWNFREKNHRGMGMRHGMCGHEIWVMKEGNNWVKLWDIPLGLGYPMCCTHEGALFFARDNIFIHDNEKGTIKPFEVHGVEWSDDVHTYIGYVGSLVTPLVAEKPPVIHTYSTRKKRNSPKGMDVLKFG